MSTAKPSKPSVEAAAAAPDSQLVKDCTELLRALSKNAEEILAPNSPYRELGHAVTLLNKRMRAVHKQASQARDQQVIDQTEIRKQREHKDRGKFLPLTAQNSVEVLDPRESSPSNTSPTTGAPGQSPPSGSPPSRNQSSRNQSISLATARKCYICKQPYHRLAQFYDHLCPTCATFNWQMRQHSGDCRGRIAVVTGGRIKIGFQIGLKLLRAGACVGVTSRFPLDTLTRYRQEDDAADWLDRLTIFSADFRFLPMVNALCGEIRETFAHLDILINNAAQTIRRPPEYYRHLLRREADLAQELADDLLGPLSIKTRAALTTPERELSPRLDEASPNRAAKNAADPTHQNPPSEMLRQSHIAAMLTQRGFLETDGQHSSYEFPLGQFDVDGQQLDRRDKNSWVAELDEVEVPELLEAHAVNALVPFILLKQLSPSLEASPADSRFVVNVSAMEGHFHSGTKTGFHPHTNMAKAAMNMITRTSAERFSKRRIFMNSVDTGWITNEYPHPKTEEMQREGFQPPLDEIDGASRVLAPIFDALNPRPDSDASSPVFGKFFKDYQPAPW